LYFHPGPDPSIARFVPDDTPVSLPECASLLRRFSLTGISEKSKRGVPWGVFPG